MMWDHYGGSSWLWMLPMMLIFWGGAVALVIWGVRAFTRPRGTGDSAIEILRRRLAAGEISQDEFERTKRILQA